MEMGPYFFLGPVSNHIKPLKTPEHKPLSNENVENVVSNEVSHVWTLCCCAKGKNWQVNRSLYVKHKSTVLSMCSRHHLYMRPTWASDELKTFPIRETCSRKARDERLRAPIDESWGRGVEGKYSFRLRSPSLSLSLPLPWENPGLHTGSGFVLWLGHMTERLTNERRLLWFKLKHRQVSVGTGVRFRFLPCLRSKPVFDTFVASLGGQ